MEGALGGEVLLLLFFLLVESLVDGEVALVLLWSQHKLVAPPGCHHPVVGEQVFKELYLGRVLGNAGVMVAKYVRHARWEVLMHERCQFHVFEDRFLYQVVVLVAVISAIEDVLDFVGEARQQVRELLRLHQPLTLTVLHNVYDALSNVLWVTEVCFEYRMIKGHLDG